MLHKSKESQESSQEVMWMIPHMLGLLKGSKGKSEQQHPQKSKFLKSTQKRLLTSARQNKRTTINRKIKEK